MQYRLRWDDLRLVLAIGRAGSLAAAARDLHVDHSTVHRRIGRIEAQLGARLFERHRSGFTPTPAGEEAIAAARRVEEDIARLENRLAGEDMRPSGVVRVTTSATILIAILTPIFAALRRARPEIVLEVGTTSQSVSMTRREADVAVRVINNPPEHLVGRRVGQILMPVYASRASFGDEAGADDPDPAGYDWVGFDEGLAHIPPAKWMEANVPAERIVYRSDTSLAMADAVREGIGVAPLPHVLGDRDPHLRRLRPGPMPEDARALWLLTHPDLVRVARIRAVMDFLATEIRASVEPRTAK